MIRVKICGLSRSRDIDAVNSERPEYIGFVFAPSSRQVTADEAARLRAQLAPAIAPVGVFVDAEISLIAALAERGVIDFIQLHGAEDEEYISTVKALTGKPIIKALSVRKGDELGQWLASAADYLLFDSPGGGSGRSFDWNLLTEIPKPFFLAGGLNPANVGVAVAKVRPFAVDVSSGVETEGLKDHAKIKEFIGRVRNG